MKKVFLFVILVSSITVNAQSLKDALFSGKLKSDTGTVIRKGDDLSTKIDTSKKKPVEPQKKVITSAKDSSASALSTQSSANVATTQPSTNTLTTQIDSSATPGAEGKDVAASDNNAAAKDNTVTVKDNNKIWKEFVDSLTSTMKTEVLPSKKIKSGTYYVLVEYEIGIDGQVSVNNISCSPENTFLQQQVKERVMLTAPQMIPLLNNGKPRKVNKKYNLILTKA